MKPKKKHCAVTMVYNEPYFMSLWISHYGAAFGYDQLYLIDHGSDDGSTVDLPRAVNRIRIPRSAFNDDKRAAFVSELCSALLRWYSGVIYTDVDELLVPDPDYYPDLDTFCEEVVAPVVTAVGVDVRQVLGEEVAIRPEIPILQQRRWARFNYSMCKPVFTRLPIKWTPGFHFSDHPTAFDRLFNFHLNRHDIDVALSRLRRSREMEWQNGSAGSHQRVTDEILTSEFEKNSRLGRVSSSFGNGDDIVARYIRYAEDFLSKNPDVKSSLGAKLALRCEELILIPDRFKQRLPAPKQ